MDALKLARITSITCQGGIYLTNHLLDLSNGTAKAYMDFLIKSAE